MLKKENRYYLFDDVILDKLTFDSLKLGNQSTLPRNAVTTEANSYWDNGVVYYTISPSFTSQEIQIINDGINHFRQNTSIDFIATTNVSNRFVSIAPSTIGINFSSSIGKKTSTGTQQDIGLVPGGFDIGSVIHEIGHAIGFYHEQSRADRDNFISVIWDNIGSDPNDRWQYQTYNQQGRPGADLGAFDWQSIMLYSSGSPLVTNPVYPYYTMVRAADQQPFTAQRTGLSAGDIASSAYLYGPPFAKIRQVFLYVNSYNPPSGQRVGYEYETYLDFYADEACTIPTSLPINKNITFVYRDYSLWSSDYTVYSVTATANLSPGQQSYRIQRKLRYSHPNGSLQTVVYNGFMR